MQLGIEKSIQHKSKLKTASISFTIVTGYHIANQHCIFERNYTDAIQTSENCNTYKENRDSILQKKFQSAFEKSAIKKSNFTPINLHEAIVYEAMNKITNTKFNDVI